MLNIYFGAPLFSLAEQRFNHEIVTSLRERFGKDINVYLPQENDEINDKTQVADSIAIFNGDLEHLDKADVMIALLDGQVIDPGLAAEIGYCFKAGIPVYGVITDVRVGSNRGKEELLASLGENQNMYFNLFVIGAIKSNGHLFSNIKDLFDSISKLVKPVEVIPDGEPQEFYVDGSYMTTISEKYAGWGWYSPIHGTESGKTPHEGHRQVTGEIMACMKALEFAAKNDIKEVIIYYDYVGIKNWATGDWKANKPATQAYKKYIGDIMFDYGVKIKFVHTKGHTGIEGNENADELAKKGLNVSDNLAESVVSFR